MIIQKISIHMITATLLTTILASSAFALAVTYDVNSIAELQTKVEGAVAGDEIILADGEYINSTIKINSNNVTVRSATPGGVFLNGINEILISGSHVRFGGFQFTSGSIPGVVITVSGNNTLTQLNFDGYSAQKYINIQGQYNDLTYSNFRIKPVTAPLGNLIHIAPNGIVPNYARIRYCSFQHMPGNGGDNGNECIRIANGVQSTNSSRTIVEYCYFNNTGGGDSEVISVKSRENVLRYNTFTNNQNAMMVFRNGNDNVAYGNHFINAGGIRVKEANNIFSYNNYFENSGVGGTMTAVSYDYISPNLKNINFLHNTFIDCGMIDLGSGATNNTWANNIFKKSSGNIFAGSTSGISWAENIYKGTLGISIPSGMTNADPLLKPIGYYGLTSASPAINASSASYPMIIDIANIDDDPFLLLDISGQARPNIMTQKDVGAYEFVNGGAITRSPLTLTLVGPSFLGGPGAATSKPTTSPTTTPTASPTTKPSNSPTASPTTKPTTAKPVTAKPTSKTQKLFGRALRGAAVA